MHRALTGLSLSASSVGSRPAVHAPITHENEQGPGGHRARLRVTRTTASRLRRGGSEVGESTRGLDGMSLWAVRGCSRGVGEASLAATVWEKWWGAGRGANIYLTAGTTTAYENEKGPHNYLILYLLFYT